MKTTAGYKIFRMVFFLCIALYGPTTHAETDESWQQVFNFQLKLAEQGNVKAQYILGEMYEQGRGVDKNTDTAIEWYQKAEKNGHKDAAKRIARVHENIRLEALEKTRAEAEKKRQAEEKARQLALQKQREEQERIKAAQLAKAKAAEEAQRKEEEAKLSPEERAQKIKEAQERAVAIAKQNALLQQQAADAELKKYRASLKTSNQQPAAKPANTKFQDAFE